MIVDNFQVVPGAPAISIATIDFLARGGDQYPYRGTNFTPVGTSYQQALANYITDNLGGIVTAADYPEGGEGRITTLGNAALAGNFNNNISQVARTFDLEVYPNPTNSNININYALDQDSDVQIYINNIFGQQVATLWNATQYAGQYNLSVNLGAYQISTGTYFLSIVSEKGIQTLSFVKE